MSWSEDMFLSPVSQWVSDLFYLFFKFFLLVGNIFFFSDLFYVCHSGRLFYVGDCLGQHCPLERGLRRPSEGNSLEPVDRALGQGPAGGRDSCQTLCPHLSPSQGSTGSSSSGLMEHLEACPGSLHVMILPKR